MHTVLCVDDHVKTDEDSTAIIAFADLSTFLLKPESEIVVSNPPHHDSKIGLVLGNIWTNVKKMAKDGTMEVDMSQAVAGSRARRSSWARQERPPFSRSSKGPSRSPPRPPAGPSR